MGFFMKEYDYELVKTNIIENITDLNKSSLNKESHLKMIHMNIRSTNQHYGELT